MSTPPPLIVTLTLDEFSHNYFTALRNQYFPKHCNYLEAHLTLFHNLPVDIFMIDDVLKQLSGRVILNLEITGIKNIGNGVAYRVECDELLAVHKTMQQFFKQYLITNDRKKLWPHITVQNKVTNYKALQTTAILNDGFKSFTAQGTGFSTWLYCKGPWQLQHHYPFTGNALINQV